MKCNQQSIGAVLATLSVISTFTLRAEVKVPSIFGDHMVLQQDTKLAVWGTADPGEAVTVKIGDRSGATNADADGKWRVNLDPLPTGTSGLSLVVSGKNSLSFSDVVVGDVWLCSGQSNMEFSLDGAHNAATELPKANDPLLRLFVVTKRISMDPLSEVGGKWELCTPETAAHFSGVGYFFGRELRSKLNRPVGLIGAYWGGTPAQTWISKWALQERPSLKKYAEKEESLHASYAQAIADPGAAQKAYQDAIDQWTKDQDAARAAGQAAPATPKPAPPASPDGGPNSPSNLFNGMIAPIIPYALKGVIWYQGESNAFPVLGEVTGPDEYPILFATLVKDWRTRWEEGDFPFLFVQLSKLNEPNWGFSKLREAQTKSLSVPNTGMVVTYDIGDQNNVHPKDKLDVGVRLALLAQHVAYGQNVVYSGPVLDQVEVKGNTIELSFTQVGGGLVIGSAPWVPDGSTPLPTSSLVGFTVAGPDNKWLPAEAKIEGNLVVVSSPDVPQPVAARYAYDSAVGNLYNKEGLPAVPFRTDGRLQVTRAIASPAP